MQGSSVLVVERDRIARDALVTGLRFVGAEVRGAKDAIEARSFPSHGTADVLILADDTTVTILTRRDPSSPGYLADEILLRPVAACRIVERVEALVQKRRDRQAPQLAIHGLHLDLESGVLSRDASSLRLAAIDRRLMAFFMRNTDRVHTRTQLLRRLWPSNSHVDERTVDVHVGRLRRALRRLACGHYLQTVRGSGYRFSAFA
jgi:DNA-binding response OmpR family regulator